jgi:molybdopterin-containing oxidoreductase family iron-sulfur binding subunit
MEKCTFCIQRIRRATRGGKQVEDGGFAPACVQACPTSALNFGDFNDSNSKISRMAKDKRGYELFEELGTSPNVVYLKKVEANAH